MADPLKQPGAFSWNELMTTDPQGAKDFYGKLFGWSFKDETSAAMTYTMASNNDTDCAGIMAIPEDAAGMPPAWGAYVTVEDVDKSAALVAELGGKIIRPPEDIPDVGRFCVLQDPQGAILMMIAYTC